MGTKENPGIYDCYGRAMPDEPMFTLLGRDPDAPSLVSEWADKREADVHAGRRPPEDLKAVEEARECARRMRTWREENDEAWRRVGNNSPPYSADEAMAKAIEVLDDPGDFKDFVVAWVHGDWVAVAVMLEDDSRQEEYRAASKALSDEGFTLDIPGSAWPAEDEDGD